MADLTLEQAKAEISNRDGPFYKGNRDVIDSVNRAFERQYPGLDEIGGSGNLPPHLNDEAILGVKQPQPNPLAPKPSSQPNQPQPQQSEQLSQEHAENIRAMRDYWGFDFDWKAQVAKDVYGELVGAGVSDTVIEKLNGMGNSMPVLDLLVKARSDDQLYSALRTIFAALAE